MRGMLERHPVLAYFVLAFGIAWAFWLPLSASSRNLIPVRLPAIVFYNLAGLGPLLAALIVSAAEGGRSAVRALLRKLLKWRVSLRWYVAALVGYPALFLVALFVDVMLGGKPVWPQQELSVSAHIDFIVGTMHFYRGDARPDNELVGVQYCCSIEDSEAIAVSWEHAEHRWVTAEEARGLLPAAHWLAGVIDRAEAVRALSSPELFAYYGEHGFEV